MKEAVKAHPTAILRGGSVPRTNVITEPKCKIQCITQPANNNNNRLSSSGDILACMAITIAQLQLAMQAISVNYIDYLFDLPYLLYTTVLMLINTRHMIVIFLQFVLYKFDQRANLYMFLFNI